MFFAISVPAESDTNVSIIDWYHQWGIYIHSLQSQGHLTVYRLGWLTPPVAVCRRQYFKRPGITRSQNSEGSELFRSQFATEIAPGKVI